ncbi:hypothetical protein ACSL9C_000714 [Vibrio navarrensis]
MAKLGRKGENFFESLCLDANLTVNCSNMDETGWDFYVEFPFEYENEKEITPSPIECKVQVKSTEKDIDSVPIKLTNLLRFVKDPKPTYIFFLKYEENEREPKLGYLVHIDEEIIKSVLRRIREHDQSGKDYKLNEKSMKIKFTKDEFNIDLTGKSLAEAMKRHIPEGMDIYVEKKLQILKEISEDTSGTLRFNMSMQELENLVDMTLGMEKNHPSKVQNVVATNKRFGIENRKPHLELDEATILVGPLKPTATGNVSFRRTKFSAPESFDADMYYSALTNMIDKKMQKLLIKGKFFELVIYPYANTLKLDFSLDNFISTLQDLKRTVFFLDHFFEKCDNYHLDLNFGKYTIPDLVLGSMRDYTSIFLDKDVVSDACEIADFFNLPANMKVTLDDLEINKDFIHQMKRIIKPNREDIFEIKFNTLKDEQLMVNDNACLLFFLKTTIGEYIVGFILSICGKVTETEEYGVKKYPLIVEKSEIVRKIVLEKNIVMTHSELTDEFKKAEELFEEKYKVVSYYE